MSIRPFSKQVLGQQSEQKYAGLPLPPCPPISSSSSEQWGILQALPLGFFRVGNAQNISPRRWAGQVNLCCLTSTERCSWWDGFAFSWWKHWSHIVFSHLHDAGWCHWNSPITTEKLMDQSTEPEVSHSCWAWTVDHVSSCCLCVCICVVFYCLTSEDVFSVATIRETPFSTTLVCD